MPATRFSRQAKHCGTDVISQAVSLLGVALCDKVVNFMFGSRVEISRDFLRLRIVTVRALQDQTSRRMRICGITSRRLFKQIGKTCRNGFVGAQNVIKRDRLGLYVAIKNTFIKTDFVPKSSIETWGLDRQRRGDIRHANAVINSVRESGPLDVLVVNAGIILFGDALEQDPDDVERLFRINIHAPYYAAVEAARQMPDGGRIIIIGSVNGDRMPLAGLASYAVSKSALQGLARGLARDFGPRGITVNVVQPGPIDTDANPEDGPLKEVMHSFMALKRHGRPEEVAGMVAWLAGPEAGFVTGAMHTIDGAFGA